MTQRLLVCVFTAGAAHQYVQSTATAWTDAFEGTNGPTAIVEAALAAWRELGDAHSFVAAIDTETGAIAATLETIGLVCHAMASEARTVPFELIRDDDTPENR